MSRIVKVKIKEKSAKYPSVRTMLEVSMDEYTKERERTNTLDNKASAFISAIIAIFTLYIPIIPFTKLGVAYSSMGKYSIICITIILCIMVASVICLLIAFTNLYKGFKLEAYYRVEFSNLNDDGLLSQSENDVQKGLVDHYNTILNGNAKINNKKAEHVAAGLKYSIFSFALLSISAIALIIMLGSIGNV